MFLSPFKKTLSHLEAEERARPGVLTMATAALLVAWGLWLALSTTTVYSVSDEGRLLAAGAASPLQSPVVGVIAETRLALGAEVRANEVLVVLDASAEKLRRDEEQAKLDGLAQAVASLELIIEAERGLADATDRAGATRVSSAAAKAQAAREIASFARQQNDAVRKLQEASLVSGLEALRATEEVRRQRGQFLINSAETSFVAADSDRMRKEAEVRLLNLGRDLSEMRARGLAARAVVAQLDWDIARRTLRAPVDGTVADVAALTPGTVVSANQALATIVPKTKMRWVASFPAREAVGRIRPGQPARVRLDAYPWTAYGPLFAEVTAVGSEPRDQRVRVELELTGNNPNVQLAHGMTGTTDVSVERLSPLRLLLRLSGQGIQEARPTESPSPAPLSPVGQR